MKRLMLGTTILAAGLLAMPVQASTMQGHNPYLNLRAACTVADDTLTIRWVPMPEHGQNVTYCASLYRHDGTALHYKTPLIQWTISGETLETFFALDSHHDRYFFFGRDVSHHDRDNVTVYYNVTADSPRLRVLSRSWASVGASSGLPSSSGSCTRRLPPHPPRAPPGAGTLLGEGTCFTGPMSMVRTAGGRVCLSRLPERDARITDAPC